MKIISFRDKYFFLSNFYPIEIIYDGKKYPTAEHAFQSAKCVDDNDKEKIRLTKSASHAKRIGRIVRLKSDWDLQKDEIMENILQIKFENKNLRDKLMKTFNCEIVEQNVWHDMYWGVCVCDRHMQQGKNQLGKLLMKIREDVA